MPNETIPERTRNTYMSQVSSTVRRTHQSPMFLTQKGKAGTAGSKRSRGKGYFRAISHFGDCMKLWEHSRAGLRAMVLSSACHFGGSESFTTMPCYLTLR